jgi:hypothetical protein
MTRLTQEAIETAYGKLPELERVMVSAQAQLLENKLSTPDKPFGRLQALELLAKLGVWMCKNE